MHTCPRLVVTLAVLGLGGLVTGCGGGHARGKSSSLVAASVVAGTPAPAAPTPSAPAAPAPASPGAPQTYGRIVRADGQGTSYSITSDDALWAARMLVGEAGGADDVDDAAVLWCMLNSYTLRPVRQAYPTFHDFLRAYCTPLQPFLTSQGAIDRHRRLGTPMVEVQPGKWQLRRHVELQARPWTQLPAPARALVERVLRGQQPSPCGNATQFCSTATYFQDANGRRPDDQELVTYTEDYARRNNQVWFRVPGSSPRNNCFFVEARFQQLPSGVVTVRP
jgi:hypothetical protein